MNAGYLEPRKGKCRRCGANIEGPPNKKYCEACRKIVTKGAREMTKLRFELTRRPKPRLYQREIRRKRFSSLVPALRKLKGDQELRVYPERKTIKDRWGAWPAVIEFQTALRGFLKHDFPNLAVRRNAKADFVRVGIAKKKISAT